MAIVSWTIDLTSVPGTGRKTHTLIKVILQLTSANSANPKPLRVLVCDRSNLAVEKTPGGCWSFWRRSRRADWRSRLRYVRRQCAVDSTLNVKAGRSDEDIEVITWPALDPRAPR